MNSGALDNYHYRSGDQSIFDAIHAFRHFYFYRSVSLIRSKTLINLTVFIQTVYFVRGAVILGQYLGLAKLNSLNSIHFKVFECEYLVMFRFDSLLFGCNQSPPVIQYNAIIK